MEIILGVVLLLGFIAGVVGFGVVLYNRLVALRNRVEQAWADVDVELTRRHDLIPNLVETVKGYATHERETFEQVTEARSRAVAAGGVKEQAEAEGMLTAALRSLFAVAENYPELRASRNFVELQTELATTEDRIGGARQRYNASVRAYDTARQTVPTNIVATLFSFPGLPYFETTDPDAREAVDVRF